MNPPSQITQETKSVVVKHERALSHNVQRFPQGNILNKNHAKHAYCTIGNCLVSQGGNRR